MKSALSTGGSFTFFTFYFHLFLLDAIFSSFSCARWLLLCSVALSFHPLAPISFHAAVCICEIFLYACCVCVCERVCVFFAHQKHLSY